MAFRPADMESSLSSQSESLPASRKALKSMNTLYSGSDDAMSSPSQLSMLPLVGFTVTLSAFTLSATSSQKSRLAVMMNIALPTTDTATNMSTMAMKL